MNENRYPARNSYRISDHTSVYTAELFGILKALLWIKDTRQARSVILSDSLSGIQSITNRTSKSRPDLLRDIQEVYTDIVNAGLEVTIEWIPGHTNSSGNEAADRLAKAGLGLQAVTDTTKVSP